MSSTIASKSILLVGATGQIGHALAQRLVREGAQLTVLVRRATPQRFAPSVRVIEAPVFTDAVFRDALQGQSMVVYGVGLPEQYTLDDQVFERVNVGVLRSFLQAFEASPVRRLVYISTYEVFAARDGLVRESHPLAEEAGLSAYFAAMLRAYRLVLARSAEAGIDLTTIHPAALYGGLNTSEGFTAAIESLLNHRLWRMPVVLPGRFPLVHAKSLANAIVKAFDHRGPYLVSDGMTSLRELAEALQAQALTLGRRSYVPPVVPAGLAYGATAAMEGGARLLRLTPPLAKVQLDFITSGVEPRADKAQAELGFEPWPLAQGLKTYLDERADLLALRRAAD